MVSDTRSGRYVGVHSGMVWLAIRIAVTILLLAAVFALAGVASAQSPDPQPDTVNPAGAASNAPSHLYLPQLSHDGTGTAQGPAIYGADSTSGNIDGSWANPRDDYGATPVTCEWIDNSAGNETNENQVRYGQPFESTDCGDALKRSGFGFDGANSLSLAPGETFLLGQFTHYNQNIVPAPVPLEYVDLSIRLNFVQPALQMDMGFTVHLDETVNTRRPCPYGATNGGLCDDKVDFTSNTPQQTFNYEGKLYTLEIVGFVPGAAGVCTATTTMVDYFITAEQQRNDACIFARIIEPGPAISVAKEPDMQAISPMDAAPFTVTVTNNGTVGLDVTVADPRTPDCERTLGAIKAGEVISYTCAADNVEADFENIAVATGIFAGKEVSATDNAWVDVMAPDTATIHVVKYSDLNGNGKRDDGEPGLPGWLMCLRDADGQAVGLCHTTDANGVAVLAANTAGTFNVCEEDRPGWANTDPGNGTFCKPVTVSNAPLYAEPFPSLGNIYGVELTDHSQDLLTWTYTAYQFEGSVPMQRWGLALPTCIDAGQIDPAGTTPGYVFGTDDAPGGTGLTGIYWDTPNGVEATGTPFLVTFKQSYDVGEAQAGVTASSGDPASNVKAIAGPVCNARILLGNKADATPAGQLEVRTEITPNADTGRFDLSIDNSVLASAVGNGGTTNKHEVAAGLHTIGQAPATDTDAADYLTSVSCVEARTNAVITPDAQGRVPVQNGEDVVCTYSNIRKGTVVIAKEVNGGTAPAAWQYSGTLGNFTLPAGGGQQTFARLTPGAYAVTETGQPGWLLTGLQCTDPDGGTTADPATGNAAIDLDPGETVVCTYVSGAPNGSLTIVKQVEGTSSADWQFGGTLGSFSLPAAGGQKSFANLQPGAYTVAEQVTGDWYVRSLACNDPDGATTVTVFEGVATIDVDAGEAITCTFVNRYSAPSIAFDKSVSSAAVYPNTPVTYTFIATNNGQTPLVNAKVTDPLCAVAPVIDGIHNAGDVNGNDLLDPGEGWRFTCGLVITADTYNQATVTATSPGGTQVSATDDATVRVLAPGLTIIKKANRTVVYRGDKVTYTIQIQNVGNAALTNVVVEDGMADCTLAPKYLGNGDNVLSRWERWQFTCTVALLEDTVNVATVTATDPAGNTLHQEASATVKVIQPMIKIDKMVDKPYAYPGERANFLILVSNTGDQPLYSVTLKDSLPQCQLSKPTGDVGNDRILSPREQWAYTCAVPVCDKGVQGVAKSDNEVGAACVPDELCDDFTNTATVTAKDRNGRTWQDTDTVAVDVLHPAIKVTKSVDKPVITTGQSVKFTVGVKNTGDIKLVSVNVADSLPACTLSTPTGDNENGTLDPGETWNYTCSLPLTQNTTNTATATAYDPNGKKVTGTASVDVKVNPETSACVDGSAGMLYWVAPQGGVLRVNMLDPKQGPHTFVAQIAKIDLGNGKTVYGYCMDAEKPGQAGPFCWEGGVSDCRVAYLIAKYPPALNNNMLHTARQAAVWHYTNGYNLNLNDPTTSSNPEVEKAVREHYLAILADVDKYAGDGNLCKPGETGIEVTPPNAVNELPAQAEHPFKVKLTKGGYPLAGYVVTVTTDFGTLTPTSATTDINGEAQFTITSSITGTAHFTATAVVQIPATQRYGSKLSPLGRQPIGTPELQTIIVVGHATKTWVTNPVGLSGFCAEDDPTCDMNADFAPTWLFLPYTENNAEPGE